MIFNVVRAGRFFCRFQQVVGSQIEVLPGFCFPKSASHLRTLVQRHEARRNVASAHSIIFDIGCSKAFKKINMSSSLELLKGSQGFHSDVKSSIITDAVANVGGLPSVKLDEKSQDSLSARQDHTCSLSVQSTPDIERKYVHRVYDAIAPHFSSTRFAKWPKVASFLNSLVPGSVILDAGCGNGKYLGLNPYCFYIGCDISTPLINICAERGHEVIVADAVNLPYRTGFGDAAISIAVLHHLSTESRRRKAIEELIRVVRPGGLVLITVWAVEQEDRSLLAKWTPLLNKYDEEWIGSGSLRVRSSPLTATLSTIPETEENSHLEVDELRRACNQNMLKDLAQQSKEETGVGVVSSRTEDGSIASRDSDIKSHQEYFVPWHLPYHRAEISGASASALANGLAKKDDKKGAVVYNRYYHVFIKGELER
ncbi:tRNA (carboxymethyluridine(34)-5-O)-methyltransferase isoform X2 [Magnolia sinica]|nr:tRNA (carboxymethyluridine(34)-5-O)-methyltransferase isoform X2 [Magnolia sinica]